MKSPAPRDAATRGPVSTADIIGHLPGAWVRRNVRITAILFLLSAFSLATHAATVFGRLHTTDQHAMSTIITFSPTNDVLISNGELSAGPNVSVGVTNGYFSTPLDGGDYTVSLQLVGARRVFRISVPNDSGSYNIIALMNNPKTYTYTNYFGVGGFSGIVSNLFSIPIKAVVITNTLTWATNWSALDVTNAGNAEVNGRYIPISANEYVQTNLYGKFGDLIQAANTNVFIFGHSQYGGWIFIRSGGYELYFQNFDGDVTNIYYAGQDSAPAPTVVSYDPPVVFGATFSYTTNLVFTEDVAHYNVTTYTNGLCVTNIFK